MTGGEETCVAQSGGGRVWVMMDYHTEPRCFRDGDAVVFCGYFSKPGDCGVVFYDEAGKDPIGVRLPKEAATGCFYAVRIKGVDACHDRYRLMDGGAEIPDPCASWVKGLSDFGAPNGDDGLFGVVLPNPPIDRLQRAYFHRLKSHTGPEDDFIYSLHVRGFTMSQSSGVPKGHRGTFMGVADKLDHIASLGATAIELMPAYEMSAVLPGVGKTGRVRVNYWGYQKGFYFAPRSSYSSTDNPVEEFQAMVDAVHERGIAVVMQFWFPRDYPSALISAVFRYWSRVYGVDGFHLIGGGLCIESIASDPALFGLKMYYESLDMSRFSKWRETPERNISVYRDDFQQTIRHFVKGDDGTIGDFYGMMIRNSHDYGMVNFIASYEGLRLFDSVSYERKHNEANQENNLDGNDDNATWNCGVEGKTKRIAVLRLRRRQIFNMLVMLFFAQGTPMLFAGDELLHTQDGNNNAYCQDNAISWVNWRGESTNQGSATLSFVRFLSKYRREHGILRQSSPLRIMDYKAFGYPDVSAHGAEAWRPDMSAFSHSIGMLYCCLYAKEQDPAFIYCAYNSHWETARFALPTVPNNLKWTVVIDTGRFGDETMERPLGSESMVMLSPRSVMVIEARGRYKIEEGGGRTPF